MLTPHDGEMEIFTALKIPAETKTELLVDEFWHHSKVGSVCFSFSLNGFDESCPKIESRLDIK